MSSFFLPRASLICYDTSGPPVLASTTGPLTVAAAESCAHAVREKAYSFVLSHNAQIIRGHLCNSIIPVPRQYNRDIMTEIIKKKRRKFDRVGGSIQANDQLCLSIIIISLFVGLTSVDLETNDSELSEPLRMFLGTHAFDFTCFKSVDENTERECV